MKHRLRDLLGLYLLALIVNLTVAALVRQPGYVDAYYYFNGGLAIAEGRGLVEPYFWNTAGAPAVLPAPAFGYWQPLPSFVAALGILLFGRGNPFESAQVLYSLLGAFLPLISYAVALQVGERRHALFAGGLTIFSGIYVIYWSLPESFTPFALAGAGALALAGWGRQSWRWWVWALAGMCAGLAHLTRADGMLLLFVVVLVALLPVRVFESVKPRNRENHAGLRLRKRLAWVGLSVAGYLLVMGPWFARNLSVYDSIQAPGGLGALWLIEYNDLFNYPSNLSVGRYLSAGLWPILSVKLNALLLNTATFIGVSNLVFLTPMAILGFWRRWRDRFFLPVLLYGAALFAAMTFAFSLPGMRGGWLHSASVLVPFVMAAAPLGLEDLISWVAQRRSDWEVPKAWRVFAVASLVLAFGFTVGMVIIRVVGADDLTTVAWNQRDASYEEIGQAFDAAGVPRGVWVMSNNTPGFYFHTGRGGIPLINGDEDTLLRAADDYNVTYLVIDYNIPDLLLDFYEDGPRSLRFEVFGVFGDEAAPVTVYHITSPVP